MNAAELMKFNIFNPLIRISSYNLDRQCTIHFSIYYFISHPASCEVLALFFFFPKRFFSRANPHENDSCNLFIRKFSIIISIGSMIVRFTYDTFGTRENSSFALFVLSQEMYYDTYAYLLYYSVAQLIRNINEHSSCYRMVENYFLPMTEIIIIKYIGLIAVKVLLLYVTTLH